MNRISALNLRIILASILLLGGVIALVISFHPKAAAQLVTPRDPSQNTTLAQRLSQRRQNFGPQLAVLSQQRISSHCTVAQTGLANLKTKDTAAVDKRREVYEKMSSQLAKIIENLQRQSINVDKLASAQKSFDGSINTFSANYQTYKTAIDDAVTVGCAADPAGFYAALLEARQLRAKLASDAKSVKAAASLIRDALQSAKQTLINNSQSEKEAE